MLQKALGRYKLIGVAFACPKGSRHFLLSVRSSREANRRRSVPSETCIFMAGASVEPIMAAASTAVPSRLHQLYRFVSGRLAADGRKPSITFGQGIHVTPESSGLPSDVYPVPGRR
jgi:hypothetical protein